MILPEECCEKDGEGKFEDESRFQVAQTFPSLASALVTLLERASVP
jgi:hypothetical protein